MEFVDERVLAEQMLEWEDTYRRLLALEEYIKSAVEKLGKTVRVGNVVAKYNPGRKSYQYKEAVNALIQEADESMKPVIASTIDKHTKIRTTTSWKPVALELEIEDIPFVQGEPSVTVGLD